MEENTLLKKWLNDDLSIEERKAFEQSEDAIFNEAIIKTAKRFKAPTSSGMPDATSFEQKRLNEDTSKTNTSHLLRWFSGIAAALVILVSLYTWFSSMPKTITTAIAHTENILLPDASKVILNAKSKISFNPSSWEENRIVTLEGEAFFDVAKGERFDVETSEGIISVLGTEFNVRQRGELLQVTCYEGKVRVVSNNISQTINAGEHVSIRNGRISESLTSRTYPDWRDNLSRFEAAPLDEVVAELERHYDVNITIVNINKTLLFSGAFEHTDLELALRSITQPLGIQYRIEDHQNVKLFNAP